MTDIALLLLGAILILLILSAFFSGSETAITADASCTTAPRWGWWSSAHAGLSKREADR